MCACVLSVKVQVQVRVQSDMLQVFRVSVGRALRGDARSLLRRRVSAMGGARCASRRLCSADQKWERSCTVDRNHEEQFVFVDCIGEEPGGGARRDLLRCGHVMLKEETEGAAAALI